MIEHQGISQMQAHQVEAVAKHRTDNTDSRKLGPVTSTLGNLLDDLCRHSRKFSLIFRSRADFIIYSVDSRPNFMWGFLVLTLVFQAHHAIVLYDDLQSLYQA